MRRKVLNRWCGAAYGGLCISGCGSSGGSTQTSGTQSSEAVEGTQEQQTVAAQMGKSRQLLFLTAVVRFRSLRILLHSRYRKKQDLKWSMLMVPVQWKKN